MQLDINAFIAGLEERFEFAKTADLFEQGQSSFFPMLQSQATWKYSLHGGKLHLNDGHHVYAFAFPAEVGDEDFPAERHPDSNHAEFNKLPHQGIAQVHRADPGSIYVTLQDGAKNPTFTLQHQNASTWKGIPKKKLKKLLNTPSETTEVDPAQFMAGATKEANDMLHSLDLAAGNGISNLGQEAYQTFANAGQHPMESVLKAGAGYVGMRGLMNMLKHRPFTEGDNLMYPAATGLGMSMASRNLIKVPGV